MPLSVLTINLHKGFSPLNRKFVLPQLREALRREDPDIVFLQEVIGEHSKHSEKHSEWPEQSQFEYLADEVWSDFAYAKNAIYSEGHHGNAILSRYPIHDTTHQLISAHSIEQRGFLHAEIEIPGEKVCHAICVHLGLLQSWRNRQVKSVMDYVEQSISIDAPLLIAGDFNDWSAKTHSQLINSNKFQEAHQQKEGKLAKTFPSILPMFHLDRVYYRSLTPISASIGSNTNWKVLSDHLPLQATFSFSSLDSESG